MKAGDGLIDDSPREAYPDGATLQAFMALGFIRTGLVDPHDMTSDGVPGFVPWRIDVDYLPVQTTPTGAPRFALDRSRCVAVCICCGWAGRRCAPGLSGQTQRVGAVQTPPETLTSLVYKGVGQRQNRQPRMGLWLERVAGAVFVASGLRLMLAR